MYIVLSWEIILSFLFFCAVEYHRVFCCCWKGYHVGTRELEEMGRFFCAGLLRVGRSYFYRNNHAQMSAESANEMHNADSSWWVPIERWTFFSLLRQILLEVIPCFPSLDPLPFQYRNASRALTMRIPSLIEYNSLICPGTVQSLPVQLVGPCIWNIQGRGVGYGSTDSKSETS